MDESAIPQNNLDLAAEKRAQLRHAPSFCCEHGVRHPRIPTHAMGETHHSGIGTFPSVYQYQTECRSRFQSLAIRPIPALFSVKIPFAPMLRGNRFSDPARTPPMNGLNPAAFAAPPAFTTECRRNRCTALSMRTLDLAIARSFNFTERMAFQFRAEAFKRTESSQSRHAESLREYSAVWLHHDGNDTCREVQLSARMSF